MKSQFQLYNRYTIILSVNIYNLIIVIVKVESYDITLTESNLTVIAGLRDQTYTLTLQAYDPLFTYHHDIKLC